jgi:hypothetical protein
MVTPKEAEFWRLIFQGQHRQKVSKTLSQEKKPGMVIRVYNPHHFEGIDMRTVV